MMAMIEANRLAFALALAIALLIAWWLLARATSGRRDRHRSPDALDHGAAPAQRNQSLIDAPRGDIIVPLPVSVGMAGIGEIIAVSAQDEVEAALDAAPPQSATQAPSPETGGTDDLSRIKGVGPKLIARLGELGITRFAQIAAWSDADLAQIDSRLGAFSGRPARDSWVEQARFLAAGDLAGFEARFGKI